MTTARYTLIEPKTPALGLIVLRVDETIEQDFRAWVPPDVARLHIARVPSGDDLNPDSIGAMEAQLSTAAGLLPQAAAFDVVGYACTSATAQLGADAVRTQVTAGVPSRHVTDPLTAAIARMQGLGLRRIGLISPYTDAVAAPLRTAFEASGIAVADVMSFDESTEARVARIDPASTADAARSLAARTAVDGIFLSCTNLQTRDILGPLSQTLNLPVLSSNQVLAWHMGRCAGIDIRP